MNPTLDGIAAVQDRPPRSATPLRAGLLGITAGPGPHTRLTPQRRLARWISVGALPPNVAGDEPPGRIAGRRQQ
ncbi:hypothetical protein LAN31_22780, partial [Mycobacterium tuberculosis]|nr:hypothetical protein [Mycobacterium tuberculosis]